MVVMDMVDKDMFDMEAELQYTSLMGWEWDEIRNGWDGSHFHFSFLCKPNKSNLVFLSSKRVLHKSGQIFIGLPSTIF